MPTTTPSLSRVEQTKSAELTQESLPPTPFIEVGNQDTDGQGVSHEDDIPAIMMVDSDIEQQQQHTTESPPDSTDAGINNMGCSTTSNTEKSNDEGSSAIDSHSENEDENVDKDEDSSADDDDDDDDDNDDDENENDDNEDVDVDVDDDDDEDDDEEDSDMDHGHDHHRHNIHSFGLNGLFPVSHANQFRPLIAALKQYDNQTQQLVALQELTELLSISTEESLIGLNVNELGDALVNLLKGADGDYGELTGFVSSNPDIVLLACRCVSNLIEALPPTGSTLARQGAIEVLCSKLFEIEYIDLAEQALSTLLQLSAEYSAEICEAGGMAGCLMFLDFFATGTQRTALACAANCSKGVKVEQFGQAVEVCQVLERTIFYTDQKSAEHSCAALLHLANTFRSSPDKIERLVKPELLKCIISSVDPEDLASTSPAPLASLLKVLSVVTKSSYVRATEALDLNIVPILESIMSREFSEITGTIGTMAAKDVAETTAGVQATTSKHGSTTHVPKLAWEALHLLVILLPRLPTTEQDLKQTCHIVYSGSSNSPSLSELMSAELAENKQLSQLLAIVSRPTVIQQLQRTLVSNVIGMFLSTMNPAARYRLLMIILKVVFVLNSEQLSKALEGVKLSTFIASSMTSADSPLLSGISLLVSRIVLDKLPDQYTQMLIREGVVDELSNLASRTRLLLKTNQLSDGTVEEAGVKLEDGFKIIDIHVANPSQTLALSRPWSQSLSATATNQKERANLSEDALNLLKFIHNQSRQLYDRLVAAVDGENGGIAKDMLNQLQSIANGLQSSNPGQSCTYMEQLSSCLVSKEGVTCYELMQSGLIGALSKGLDQNSHFQASTSTLDSVEPLAVVKNQKNGPTPFNILVERLQEALSIHESLHINETYKSSGTDQASSFSALLTKQMRFQISPASEETMSAINCEEGEGEEEARESKVIMQRLRQSFRSMTLGVHAIATFGVLEAYIHPRISLLMGRKQQSSLVSAIRDLAHQGNMPPTITNSAFGEEDEETVDTDNSGDSSHQLDEDEHHRRLLRSIARSSGIDLHAVGIMDDDDDDDGSDENTDENDDVVADLLSSEGADYQSNNVTGGSTSQDRSWRVLFTLKIGNIQRIVGSSENIFRTVYNICQQSDSLVDANLWAHTFSLQFHVELGNKGHASSSYNKNGIPQKDLGDAFGVPCDSIIRLLRQLHDNPSLPLLYSLINSEAKAGTVNSNSNLIHDMQQAAKMANFVNHKLAAKVARQLEDPLMVVCSALPSWCHSLMDQAPFLVPFSARMSYLQAMSFGYSRNISRVQTMSQREARSTSRRSTSLDMMASIPLGRIQRQKVRISRNHILETALKVFETYGSERTVLEVEYFDEVGTGLGPTLEFYASIYRSLQENCLGIWRNNEEKSAIANSNRHQSYVNASFGLFPSPINPGTAEKYTKDGDEDSSGKHHISSMVPLERRAVKLFRFLGHLVAKALIDGRVLDVPIHEVFWAAVQRHSSKDKGQSDEDFVWTWQQLASVDPALARSLWFLQQQYVVVKDKIYARKDLSAKQKQEMVADIRDSKQHASVEDMSLDFTLPGYPNIELRPGGSDLPVTINNVSLYVDLVAKWVLDTGVRAQISSFCEGFDQIFPVQNMLIFSPAEMSLLVGSLADNEDWNIDTLQGAVKADHGFSPASPAVRMFLLFMGSLDHQDRRSFLQFVTGAPRLPIGGFRALYPPLTLVQKIHESPLTPDDYLPSVMTCANFIKLPNYSSMEILRRRWEQAVTEGKDSFHLS